MVNIDEINAGESTVKLLGLTSTFALLLIAAPALAAPTGRVAPCSAKSYEAYEAGNTPKALAIGRTKGCGYAYGKSSVAEARRSALDFCRAYGGDGCRVVQSSSR